MRMMERPSSLLGKIGLRILESQRKPEADSSNWKLLIGPVLLVFVVALLFIIIGVGPGGVLTMLLIAVMGAFGIGFGFASGHNWKTSTALYTRPQLVELSVISILLLVNVVCVASLLGAGVDMGRPFKVVACLAIFGSWLMFGVNVGAFAKSMKT
jgi:hypothetical protein